MAPWEIWTYDFEDEQSHPVVVFSNTVRVANPDLVREGIQLARRLFGDDSETL